MAKLDDVFSGLKGKLRSTMDRVQRAVLGVNDERVDFIMDSFHKLTAGQRSVGVAILGVIVGGIFLSAISSYVVGVRNLKEELTGSLAAWKEYSHVRQVLSADKKRAGDLESQLVKSISRIKVRPYFAKIADQKKIQMEGLVLDDIPPGSTENRSFKRVKPILVGMSFPSISIPKLMGFIREIEQSGYYLRVRDLRIQSIYGTKLHFRVDVKVHGYQLKGST